MGERERERERERGREGGEREREREREREGERERERKSQTPAMAVRMKQRKTIGLLSPKEPVTAKLKTDNTSNFSFNILCEDDWAWVLILSLYKSRVIFCVLFRVKLLQ